MVSVAAVHPAGVGKPTAQLIGATSIMLHWSVWVGPHLNSLEEIYTITPPPGPGSPTLQGVVSVHAVETAGAIVVVVVVVGATVVFDDDESSHAVMPAMEQRAIAR